ncbi:putative 2-aminoethylphosphonate ABC transporter ATP-binding protein [Paenibacillus sp. N1-5-1-14]|uniref:putative 2-aminoethylphosphonate ABC transporter ATP-binding protein n=1 Tax=Paenibacillus radicibacter TaxID=2972488 RepID=UPI0021596027|nr:putative 2-aminoethylphosphonate ABC transporter ATP-binding protein [Paenibacillus radicibacter]MCR8643077.1 putative 2-aminoethylphosphonate ABC transporter ATP-binding protein [Paenibacillus radicibacter]
MTQPFLSIQHISKSFGSFTALNHIELNINQSEFVCLLGPSGCGKTTLLRILAGLEMPNTGRIHLAGQDITGLPPAKRNFGMVFQSYALFPNLTAYDNIAYGLKGRKMSKKDVDAKVREVLELVGLAHVHDRYPAQLSGGQQQRIALARALALEPDFLLLDEPLSALDAKVRLKLRQELRQLQEKIGITTIMVTHDQEEALTLADRIVVMNHANIVQIGSPQEVYEKPATPFVADFIGAINFFPGTRLRGKAQDQGMYAVRPEHIRVVEAGTPNSVNALVRHVEFRGPFNRVMLQMLNEQEELTDHVMTVDLSIHVSQGLGLSKNQQLSLELPMERVLEFEAEAMAN